ncbi:hypothetical protein ACFWMU_34620 [Streptomyces sp. NPDC058357]|uniref:hypothetical protein n=1 Tax=unclassified Streptomyces TaxID=2593676 RepID=UPI00364CF530
MSTPPGAPQADKALNHIQGDIDGKMNPNGKKQANNVVYVAATAEQAGEVAQSYSDDSRVRVIHPDSGFDSGRVFNGATGKVNSTRVSPRIRGRVLGVAGSLMPFAQSNSYVRSFGFWGGIQEMGKDFFDPFGFHEAVETPNCNGSCDPSVCA